MKNSVKDADVMRKVPSPEPAAPIGLRERGKQERRARISRAVREVFRSKGYEAATIREIAARAGVASGTIFLYARDKRELLLMMVNDDLEHLTEESFRHIPAQAPLLDQLLAIFAPRYAYWATDPKLATQALYATISARAEEEAAETTRFHRRRHSILGKLIELLEERQRSGALAPALDAPTSAWVIMSIYLAAIRLWLADEHPQPDAGVATLRALLRRAITGFGAAPSEIAGDS
ncbi:MAG TPA: TetR/AcrR family transcriptional regulator [Candidatus Limnocylindria bacterium]|jgi:AcrR family transcriptional regulator|nr:TetR/AcrR family transcriptional regulator [Candidatus Limnocylindria bacterium]